MRLLKLPPRVALYLRVQVIIEDAREWARISERHINPSSLPLSLSPLTLQHAIGDYHETSRFFIPVTVGGKNKHVTFAPLIFDAVKLVSTFPKWFSFPGRLSKTAHFESEKEVGEYLLACLARV